MGNLYNYLSLFGRHLWAIAAAGFYFGIDGLIKKWVPEMMPRFEELTRPYRHPLRIIFLIAAVFYSGYAAWDDEHKLRLDAEKQLTQTEAERDEVRRQLNARPLQTNEGQTNKYMNKLPEQQKDMISSLASKQIDRIGRLVIAHYNSPETVLYEQSFIDAFRRSGIQYVDPIINPDGPDQTGVMISCEDTGNITESAKVVIDILQAVNIKTRIIPMLRGPIITEGFTAA